MGEYRVRELRSRSDADAQLDGSVWPGEAYEWGEDADGMGGGNLCMKDREGGRYRSSLGGGPPEEPGGR
jgi:hypothetical protein